MTKKILICSILWYRKDIGKWTAPLLALFFVISGAELDLSVFTDMAIVGIGVVYIVFRCLGKYTGTLASAKVTNCAPQICKYLGITLFPQAGDIQPMPEHVKNRRHLKLEHAKTRNKD